MIADLVRFLKYLNAIIAGIATRIPPAVL